VAVDRAVNVEALRRTEVTGRHSFSHSLDRSSQQFHVEQQLLLSRLKAAETFDRVVNVQAPRRTNEIGKHSFSHSLDRSYSIVPCRAATFA